MPILAKKNGVYQPFQDNWFGVDHTTFQGAIHALRAHGKRECEECGNPVRHNSLCEQCERDYYGG